MDPGVIFVVGTLAGWAGWIGLFRAVYVALQWFFGRPDGGRTNLLAPFAASLGVAAAGLIVSSRLAPSAGKGFGLPVVWLAMPFWAWLGAMSLALVLIRVAQSIMAVAPEERISRAKAALAWIVLAAVSLGLFMRAEPRVEILKGQIELTPLAAAALALSLIAALAAIVAAQRSARFRGMAKSTASHLALLAGSVVFGLPFAWLVITSFKEDQDMASPNGLVWIPHVRQRLPYFDPNEVYAEGWYEGQRVQGLVLERLADGSARIEISKPAVLRGLSFTERQPRIVPKMVDVVTTMRQGERVKGKVLKEYDDGRKRIEAIEPPSMAGQVFEAGPEGVELVRPIGLNYLNYPEALDYLPPETMKGLVYVKNTLIIVVLSVLGTLLSSSVVAYAFARLRFPGKNVLFLVLLSTMMLPAAVTLIPQFLIFRGLGWIDSLRPLWVPAFLGSAFNIFLLRQFFMTIPLELEDAAKIDGCSYPRTFWQVMLPQVKPALAVVAIWTFMGAWNNFMGPLIYINSPENMPISYAVQLFQGDRLNEPGLLMAFATMAMLPVLLVFFFAQRYFIEGVTLSGLGGR